MKYYSLILLSLMLSACHRPVNETSQLQLVFPQPSGQQAQSTLVPFGIRIQVTGDGLSTPIYLPWSAEDQCANGDCFAAIAAGTVLTAPSQFTLEVPTGSNRLVQVMAVYLDSADQSLKFYYGDASKSFAALEESLVVPINVLIANNVTEGRISGRYLTAVDSGPTGPMQISYKPEGKPAVPLLKSVMVSGWFETMGFAGLPLVYTVNGAVLFDGPKKLEDFSPSSSASVEVRYPAHIEQGGGPRSASTNIFGFFGNSVLTAGKKACVQGTVASPIASMKDSNNNSIQWNGFTADTTRGYAIKTASNDNSCGSLTPFVDAIQLSPTTSETEFRVDAPFLTQMGAPYSVNDISPSVSEFTVVLLPGTIDVLTGIDAFAVSSAKLSSYRIIDAQSDVLKCDQLNSTAAATSTEIRKVGSSGAQPNIFVVDPANFDAVSSPELVLCAKTAFGYLPGQQVENPSQGGNSSEGWIFVNGYERITANQCFPYNVHLERFSATGTINFNVDLRDQSNNPVSNALFSNADCTSANVTSLTVNTDGSTAQLFIKSPILPMGKLSLTGPSGEMGQKFITAGTSTVVQQVRWNGPERFSTNNSCNPVQLELYAAGDYAIQTSGGTTNIHIDDNQNNLTYWADSNCSSIQYGEVGISGFIGIPFIGNLQSRYVFVKAATGALVSDVSFKDSTNALIGGTTSVGGNFPAHHLSAQFVGGSTPSFSGDCRELSVSALDSSNVVLSSTGSSIRLKFAGNAPYHFFGVYGSLYDCQTNGALLSNPTLPPSGAATASFFVKFVGGGSNLIVKVSSPDASNYDPSMDINISQVENLRTDDSSFRYVTTRNLYGLPDGTGVTSIGVALGAGGLSVYAPSGVMTKTGGTGVPALSLTTGATAFIYAPTGISGTAFTLHSNLTSGNGGLLRIAFSGGILGLVRVGNDLKVYTQDNQNDSSPTYTHALSAADQTGYNVITIERDAGILTLSLNGVAIWSSSLAQYATEPQYGFTLGNFSLNGVPMSSNLSFSAVIWQQYIQTDQYEFDRTIDFLRAAGP